MANNPYTWTLDDAIALRKFISDNPKFLLRMNKLKPRIEGSTMEARAVTGSDVNGYLLALENIENMQKDPMINANDAGFIEAEREK